jgi:hypothetical protein
LEAQQQTHFSLLKLQALHHQTMTKCIYFIHKLSHVKAKNFTDHTNT